MRAELKRAADLVAFQRREALSRKRLSGDPRNPFRPRYGAELTFAAASQEAETLGYVKTTAQGATKALKVFLFDNVVEESRVSLEANLEEFPALALSIGEKLLGMLGLSKQTNLKML